MSHQFNNLFKDYARTPVPDQKTVNCWHIALIYTGVGLTLPAFIIATEIGLSLGMTNGIICITIAAAFLGLCACFTGYVGGSTKLSTYYITRHTFGTAGAKLTNLVMAISTFGWFGVTAAFFAKATQAVAVEQVGIDIGEPAWIIIGVILMISTALFGFKGLDKLSLVVVPLLFILLISLVIKSTAEMSLTEIFEIDGTNVMPLGVAATALIGGWMVGVTVLPDLTRYARSPAQGTWGGFISFTLGLFIVFTPCMIVALATGEKDIVTIMTTLGWGSLALVVIILSAWSSNDNNLYSSSLSLASIFESIEKWKITLMAGVAGGFIALFGTMEMYVPFLIWLGILIPPVAGLYCLDFFLRREAYQNETVSKIRWTALISWACGSFFAYATQPADNIGLGLFSFTTIPAIDAILAAGALHWLLSVVMNKKA